MAPKKKARNRKTPCAHPAWMQRVLETRLTVFHRRRRYVCSKCSARWTTRETLPPKETTP